MDYAYEVHEDATLGLMIDLIDPAKYEGARETLARLFVLLGD